MLFIIVLICVLFLYIHIYYHLKRNNDLDVIDIDYCSFDYLQEICDYRQPVVFTLQLNIFPSNTIDLFGLYDIQIQTENNKKVIPEKTISLSEYDKENHNLIFSCKNYNFLTETALIQKLQLLDHYIRPRTTIKSMYDLYFAHPNTFSVLECYLSYRTYLRVEKGKGKIIFIPPMYKKYIYPEDNIHSFSFTSPINPWSVQNEYRYGFSRVKYIEKDISEGNIISIPAYWYFSIQFSKDTIISKYNYFTSMNILSIVPTLILSSFQNK